jgi:hypothetical protein
MACLCLGNRDGPSFRTSACYSDPGISAYPVLPSQQLGMSEEHHCRQRMSWQDTATELAHPSKWGTVPGWGWVGLASAIGLSVTIVTMC